MNECEQELKNHVPQTIPLYSWAEIGSTIPLTGNRITPGHAGSCLVPLLCSYKIFLRTWSQRFVVMGIAYMMPSHHAKLIRVKKSTIRVGKAKREDSSSLDNPSQSAQ